MLGQFRYRTPYIVVALLFSSLALVFLTSRPSQRSYLPAFIPTHIKGEFGSYLPSFLPSSSNRESDLSHVPWAGRQVRVAITEVGGSHDEVVGALINAFGSLPDIKLELYQEWQRYKSADIFAQFSLGNPLPKAVKPERLLEGVGAIEPDILISTTCELDSVKLRKQFDILLERKKTYMFCLIHHADRWNGTQQQKIITPWAESGMVDFVTLSNHTGEYVKEHAVPSWGLPADIEPTIRVLPPIFPVENNDTTTQEELGFALQGDYDPSRRDYNSIFKHLQSFLSSPGQDTAEQISLHLIGHGNQPKVPEDLRSHVIFDASVDYPDFYGILSRTFALLPAFASDTYYDRKASSTVPASLIAGVPLVATRKILETYTYVTEEDIWLQEADEKDFDVIGRILAMQPEERAAKKEQVKRTRDALIEQNKFAVRSWIAEALGHIPEPSPVG